jgi:hypothetical protein
MLAMVVAPDARFLNPSIGWVRNLMRRWSCASTSSRSSSSRSAVDPRANDPSRHSRNSSLTISGAPTIATHNCPRSEGRNPCPSRERSNRCRHHKSCHNLHCTSLPESCWFRKPSRRAEQASGPWPDCAPLFPRTRSHRRASAGPLRSCRDRWHRPALANSAARRH